MEDDAGLADIGSADLLARDCSLTADPLAIDAGTTVPVPDDFDHYPRPTGTGPDVGAFERP